MIQPNFAAETEARLGSAWSNSLRFLTKILSLSSGDKQPKTKQAFHHAAQHILSAHQWRRTTHIELKLPLPLHDPFL